MLTSSELNTNYMMFKKRYLDKLSKSNVDLPKTGSMQKSCSKIQGNIQVI
jgi:hypothetical protein